MAENKIIDQGTPDFNWEALESDVYSKVERAELADKYEKTLSSINEKEVRLQKEKR